MISSISDIDIIKFNTIFTEYKEGMNEFLKEGDSLKILNDENKMKYNIENEQQDEEDENNEEDNDINDNIINLDETLSNKNLSTFNDGKIKLLCENVKLKKKNEELISKSFIDKSNEL